MLSFIFPAPPHGPEDGPVVLGAGPGQVRGGPEHLQPSPLAFLRPKTTCMPNFSLLTPSHAPEDVPVVLQVGPDPLEGPEEVWQLGRQLCHDH